jgi:ornithine carbamoyltransferase
VETADRAKALSGAVALYAEVLGLARSLRDAAAESALRAGLAAWRVDLDWFSGAHPACRFFHCPSRAAQRGGHRRRAGFAAKRRDPQAHNRMWAQMAVLHRLLGGPR